MARRPLRSLPVLLLCAGLWGGACRQPPLHPLQVEYAGCAQVFLPGPTCVLDKNPEIRLWVGLPPEEEVEIRADGWRLQAAAVAVQGGRRFTVKVPPRTWEIRVNTLRGDASWSLALTPYPWPSVERQAFNLWKGGKPEEARRLLAPRGAGPPRAEHWLALHLLTHISRQAGADGEAEAFCRQAVAAEHAAGSLLTETKDATLLVWFDLQGRRFDAASRVLSGLRLPAGAPAEAVYYQSYYRGLLAEAVGDARSALAELKVAVDQAERVGMVSAAWDAEQILGRQLQALGRTHEAAALFDRLRRAPPAGLSPCQWSELLINQAWSLLLAGEAGESPGDPLPLLEEMARSLDRGPCPRRNELRTSYFLNVALAHLQRGRLAPARAALLAARDLDRFATPLDRLWSLELEARLDLAEGRSAVALQRYDQLDALAAGTSAPEGRWRAAYGRARCYRAMDRPGAALDALAKAESLLDEQSLQVPIYEGRGTFAAQREGATRLFLELLLAGDRNAEALDVARRARSRLLRQLARGDRLMHLSAADRGRWESALTAYWQQRAALDAGAGADWELPADQRARIQEARAARYQEVERTLDQAFVVLAGAGERGAALLPPGPGEVVLAYFPLSHGWAGFAADGRSVAVHRFDLPEGAADPGTLADRLLTPFRAQIERARRVRVLPYGSLRDVDFHALPFGGDVLLAGRPVVYGLDLTPPTAGPSRERRALVVADPLGDLPAADLEADAVTAALSGQRPAWSAQVLRGEEAAADAVRPVLGRVDLLHYAGHGVFSGSGGWQSVLPLAAGTRLTLGDLLALGRPPSWVVLSGCETGRAGGESPAEGLGLAQAFLLAGSRSVIAATRPVGDRAAQGLFTELYRGWSAEPDLAVLLQQAELAWRRREPAAEWASFRLFEP